MTMTRDEILTAEEVEGKDKLEKEAEKYADEKCKDCYMCSYSECKNPYKICQRRKDRKQAYIAGAEPREKQIQIDARQIRALQKQNGELTDKVRELEAQIEKMQEKLKADLIARLEEQMQYSTSPSCTKGMELFIKSIEKWEIKENDRRTD